ncbi:NADH-quinone oxidoreductase subunit L [uncultured Ferrovibrio sp.]|jgi:NADH-quinone oxidoreductase subunit L|uniref:NADH-quinone oxidoreductase subunit L n=1 Tax=uncultured Ferrovibrio sp. TaxID=1576913 RepID=UPI00261E8CF0|nr:NADH-quinone oxidoreductase subunit L [uncultured Ferrovibrio sp.]
MTIYHLIVFLPLLAAIVAGFFGRRIGDAASMAATCIAVGIGAILSWVALYQVVGQGNVVTVKVLDWIDSGSFSVDWALKIDQLTAVMLVVVNTVSALVHIYSVGYMSHDPSRPRFFAYLSLFTFAMLMLVTADNFVQLYMGWEGVGLASYLLIGFWFHKPSANAAAIKAFVVNRVGDFGFALGIMTLFFATGSVSFETVFAAAPDLAGKTFNFLGGEWDILTVATFLLFLGAMGKSAQLGLHTWLPDAMEGPTPVSALIHAATMVTAGVFMVARCSPLFEYAPDTLAFVTVIGASTAFFAATVGLAQNDIKRVIAYSTCSQLGYMFFALGVSAYPAAIFHLFTHAFFKALLFLGAGSVIHAVDGEQDMRKMGGLWKHIKITYAMMWIGSLALAGLPFFAGYYSKDMILEAAFAAGSGVGQYAFVLGMAAAILTAFYSWRLLFMTFHGEPRADHHVMEHVHESPWVMLVPLFVLAAGALFAGVAFAPGMIGHHWQEFWGNSIVILPDHKAMEAAHDVPLWVKLGPIVVGLVGIFVAWIAYIRDTGLPARAVKQHQVLYQFLLNKWYFDEIYDFLFVRPAMWLGRLFWKGGDGKIIDGLGPDGFAATVVRLAKRASILQSGYVYHYAFAMLVGVAALVTYFFTVMGH